MNTTIHLARINQPTRIYQEGLIEDDGVRLTTYTQLPDEFSKHLTAKWSQAGWLPASKRVCSITKYLFYNENFQIMEIRDTSDELLGYYCDITTPLQRIEGEYYLLDLIVDVWIRPDLTFQELDWDEWQSAREMHQLTDGQAQVVSQTMQRLRLEIQSGTFPSQYVRQDSNTTDNQEKQSFSD